MFTTDALSAALEGRYTIERLVGEGGMAKVYLARDLRHNRQVALKVLRPDLGAVVGVDRFQSEIQVTANLQHPNLLPLFDSGAAGDLLFYVMPFVEGESLRARLDREKQLPVDEAVRLATAIAGALDYAHRKGVVHRDLKPENILIHEGQPLVADFGIALAIANAGGARITQTGLSLGTPQYMSPEQATGDRAIDARTDIYSLGALTYEMLTGEAPHTGATAQAIIAKLLTEDVRPVSVLRRTVPPHVEQAVRCALEKLPADRFETAKAFGDALANRSFASANAFAAARGARSAWIIPREIVAWSLVVALGTSAAWAFQHRRATVPSGRMMKLELTLPGLRAASSVRQSRVSISADGAVLLFEATGPAGAPQYAVRRLDDAKSTLIAGTEDATFATLSPDGKWVAFFVGRTLRKVLVSGGSPTTIASTLPGPLSWGRNDTLIIGATRRDAGRGLSLVPAAGASEVRDFVRPDSASGFSLFARPRTIGDGRVVLFEADRAGQPRIGIASLRSGTPTLLDLIGSPLGVLEGRLVYARPDGAIFAIAIDIEKGRVSGEPVALIDRAIPTGISLADDGTAVYEAGSPEAALVMVDQRGVARPLIATLGAYSTPRVSADGRRIAVAVSATNVDIWVYDLSVGTGQPTAIRLASQAGVSHLKPEWSPDGKRIFFALTRPDSGDVNSIWSQAADGSAPPEFVLGVANRSVPEAVVSRDGNTLVVRTGSTSAGGNMDIRYRTLTGDTTLRTLLATAAYRQLEPTLSPDGKWLAYVSDESERREVYVRAFPGPESKWAVSSGGGDEPKWSPDGHRLYYRGPSKMMAATIATNGGTFSVTGREALFDDRFMRSGVHPNYDVTPDGKSFLMLQRGDSTPTMMLVTNLGAALRNKVK